MESHHSPAMTERPSEDAFLTDTRSSYDAIAEGYAELFKAEPEAKPLARAVLTAFAETVAADGGGPVVEFGSGPGRVTAYLDSVGMDVRGVDLSPVMVTLARQTYPQLRFDEGSMTELGGFADGSLRGIVGWYSLIHLPPARVPAVLAEFHRLLGPGGHLALAFQAGSDISRHTEGFGRSISLDFHRMQPDTVEAQLGEAGFEVRARLVREAEPDEKTPQAYLLARKRARV
ncbi:class I SAM-dependent DNA methyltransferase [Streptomyces sp. NPDC096176]|uniref:class I SAM-dependent DNA methyltransferase n=1 Tax=Streptomyces sp. NPDC096176 TaxID=3366079 RepID=UPI003811599B